MLKPDAYFDSLSLSYRLSGFSNKLSEIEIHLFSYLSCLLSLFKKRPLSFWGYKFALTPEAFPYSVEIHDAIYALAQKGRSVREDNLFHLTRSGEQEYFLLRQLHQNEERESYLDGACSCLLTLPPGAIRDALIQLPGIKTSLVLSRTDLLLTNSTVHNLYEQFNSIGNVIGFDVKDLMVPAVIWISYVTQVSKSIDQVESLSAYRS